MPTAKLKGAKLHYIDVGGGTPVLFLHGLLWSHEMFRAQIDELKGRFRCVAMDWRGQGRSEVTASGYDMETLADDAAELILQLGIGPCHVVGLSMGGFVAMRLAARKPQLVRSIVLLETSADAEPSENVPKYKRLNLVARWLGLGLVANKVMPIMFGQTFLNDAGRAEERERWKKALVGNHKIGITRAVRGVIERKPIYDELGNVTCPALVMVGDEDAATVPAKAERIANAIKGAKLVTIPRAGHSATIEEPAFVSRELSRFLT